MLQARENISRPAVFDLDHSMKPLPSVDGFYPKLLDFSNIISQMISYVLPNPR